MWNDFCHQSTVNVFVFLHDFVDVSVQSWFSYLAAEINSASLWWTLVLCMTTRFILSPFKTFWIQRGYNDVLAWPSLTMWKETLINSCSSTGQTHSVLAVIIATGCKLNPATKLVIAIFKNDWYCKRRSFVIWLLTSHMAHPLQTQKSVTYVCM